MTGVACEAATEREYSYEEYINANAFLKETRNWVALLSKQEIMTLRGQALSGDIDGAKRGLRKLINRRYNNGRVK